MKLTETTATALENRKTLRDKRFKGLFAIGRKGPTTWAYQTDLRRNGRFVRTVRVTLGKQNNMSLKQARIAAAKAQEQIRDGIDPNSKTQSAKNLTLLDVIEDHIKERDLAERTEWDYRRHWTNKKMNTLYPLRNMHPGDINRADCRAIKARLVKRGTTLASGALRVLRLTLNHARRLDETIKENPAEFLIIPPTPRRDAEPVDLHAFAEGVVTLPFMWRELWTTCLLTGARSGSLLKMRRSDVDVENRTITLSHVKTMKNGAVLPIGKRLAEMLGEYIEWPSAGEWLWPGIKDQPLKVMRRRTWSYGPHQLRHNFSILATRAGTPFAEQRMLMTHALPGMGQIYTDPNALVEHLRQYAEAIENFVAIDAPDLFV